MSCPFCKINKEKTKVIEEKENILIIFSNPRLMPGHLLIIPKRHIEKLSELNETEKKELFNTLIEYQERILSKIASGCDIRQNCRPFQKQSELKVNHLHFHLQPREFKDELYEKCQIFETNIFKQLTEDEINKILKNLVK